MVFTVGEPRAMHGPPVFPGFAAAANSGRSDGSSASAFGPASPDAAAGLSPHSASRTSPTASGHIPVALRNGPSWGGGDAGDLQPPHQKLGWSSPSGPADAPSPAGPVSRSQRAKQGYSSPTRRPWNPPRWLREPAEPGTAGRTVPGDSPTRQRGGTPPPPPLPLPPQQPPRQQQRSARQPSPTEPDPVAVQQVTAAAERAEAALDCPASDESQTSPPLCTAVAPAQGALPATASMEEDVPPERSPAPPPPPSSPPGADHAQPVGGAGHRLQAPGGTRGAQQRARSMPPPRRTDRGTPPAGASHAPAAGAGVTTPRGPAGIHSSGRGAGTARARGTVRRASALASVAAAEAAPPVSARGPMTGPSRSPLPPQRRANSAVAGRRNRGLAGVGAGRHAPAASQMTGGAARRIGDAAADTAAQPHAVRHSSSTAATAGTRRQQGPGAQQSLQQRKRSGLHQPLPLRSPRGPVHAVAAAGALRTPHKELHGGRGRGPAAATPAATSTGPAARQGAAGTTPLSGRSLRSSATRRSRSVEGLGTRRRENWVPRAGAAATPGAKQPGSRRPGQRIPSVSGSGGVPMRRAGGARRRGRSAPPVLMPPLTADDADARRSPSPRQLQLGQSSPRAGLALGDAARTPTRAAAARPTGESLSTSPCRPLSASRRKHQRPGGTSPTATQRLSHRQIEV
eukprot:TRINITY_DN3103_c2_g1_i2.p1 TRINITY_DN3103_c2_g1~~TRINITY_DN3103_c2_g1_i2.p1  ORF type:complete len:685 (+),score=82.20 TRINITY_DN3103_c2_g1_i2:74-2128(+)